MNTNSSFKLRTAGVLTILSFLVMIVVSNTAVHGSTGSVTSLPVATVTTLNNNPSTPYSQLSNESKMAWMSQLPILSGGCFNVTYPSTTWISEPCAVGAVGVPPPVQGPRSTLTTTDKQANSRVPIAPQAGGFGGDDDAYAGGSFIEDAVGWFSTETGFSSETDDHYGSNSYSLQLNTNTHPCSSAYFTSNDCFEQFVFYQQGSTSQVYIQYWLIGYGSPCPSEPGIIVWSSSNGSCYGDGPITNTIFESPANLAGSSMTGYSTVQGNAQDAIKFCDASGNCYQSSIFGTILYLANWWTVSEFNVFGAQNLSEAVFAPSGNTFSLIVNNELFGTSGGQLTASCDLTDGSFTGETNNLSIGACNVPGGYIVFDEHTNTIEIYTYPTTDTFCRSVGLAIDQPLPVPWWPPYQSGYEIGTPSGSGGQCTTLTYYTHPALQAGSHYLQTAVSGYVPDYAWHTIVYVNGAEVGEGDVGRNQILQVNFNI
jgi:hypothetical protein